MSSTHRIRLFVAACVAGLCWAGFGSLTSSAAGKEYRVQFDRKEKAGQTSKVTVSGAHQQTVGMNGAPMDQKAYKYELTATREVQKVDADGQAVQVSLTVAQCKVIRGGKQADEVKPGAVVIVTSSGGKPRVEPKDSSVKLTDDAKAILGRAANVESAGGSGDKAFGTDKPRQIGESWPVNSKYIAESLSKMLAAEIAGAGRFAAVPTLKEKDVTGRVTLAGASRVGGVECLDLRVKMKISNFNPPMPPVAKVEKGEMTISLTGKFPVDASVPMLTGKQQMSSTIVMAMSDPSSGQQVKMEMNSADSSDTKVSPVK